MPDVETPVADTEVPEDVSTAFDAVMAAENGEAIREREEREELELEGMSPDGEPLPEPAAEEDEGDEQDTEPEPEDGEGDSPTPEGQEAPTIDLDPTLRRAAQQFGWDDEAIDAFVAANPEMGVATFQRLADTFGNLSSQFTGQSPQVAPAPTQAPQQAPQSPAVSGLDKLFSEEGLQAFADANGDDLVETFLKPFKSEVYEPLKAMQASAEAAERQALANEAQTAIARLGSDYASLYGGATRTPEQQQAVNQLAAVADQLRAGARLQGQELSVTAAIDRAHLILSAEQRKADGRKEVQKSVQSRAKSLTSKPTMRRSKATEAKPGDSSAAAAVETFWQNVGEDVEF